MRILDVHHELQALTVRVVEIEADDVRWLTFQALVELVDIAEWPDVEERIHADWHGASLP